VLEPECVAITVRYDADVIDRTEIRSVIKHTVPASTRFILGAISCWNPTLSQITSISIVMMYRPGISLNCRFYKSESPSPSSVKLWLLAWCLWIPTVIERQNAPRHPVRQGTLAKVARRSLNVPVLCIAQWTSEALVKLKTEKPFLFFDYFTRIKALPTFI
jgi:hypothetical protein